MIFSVFQKIGFGGILGPPSYGIGATIRIGREMLCLPYAGFFFALFKIIVAFSDFRICANLTLRLFGIFTDHTFGILV